MNLRRDDGAKYNFERDILQLFTEIAAHAGHTLAKANWDYDVRKWAEYSGLKEEDLVRAMECVARFQYAATEGPSHDPRDAWTRAGFDTLAPPARVGCFYAIGMITMRQYFLAARENLSRGQAPVGADETSELTERLMRGLSPAVSVGFGKGQ